MQVVVVADPALFEDEIPGAMSSSGCSSGSSESSEEETGAIEDNASRADGRKSALPPDVPLPVCPRVAANKTVQLTAIQIAIATNALKTVEWT